MIKLFKLLIILEVIGGLLAALSGNMKLGLILVVLIIPTKLILWVSNDHV